VIAPEIATSLLRSKRKTLTRLPEQQRRMKGGRHYCNHPARADGTAQRIMIRGPLQTLQVEVLRCEQYIVVAIVCSI
jgi:hypothetical protein